MNVRESISLALGSLRNNKMRSFLTLLGIIVGIASVITILTLGHSLKTQASESIVSSGANDLMVNVVQRPTEEQEEAGLTSGPMSMPNGEYIEPAMSTTSPASKRPWAITSRVSPSGQTLTPA